MAHVDHWCIACAKAGVRRWGAFGFAAWPAVAGHSIAVGGYVWACEEHREAVEARWRRENGHRAAGDSAGQPEPRTGGALSGAASDAVQGALDL